MLQLRLSRSSAPQGTGAACHGCRRACLRLGLFRTCGRAPGQNTAFARPGDASQEIRRTVRPVRIRAAGWGLEGKMARLARKLDDERVQLALCDGDREGCASAAALQLLAIVDVARERDGRARLGE